MNTKILTVCFAIALAGCVDTDLSDTDDVSSTAKIASNSMLPGIISGTNIYAAPLTGGAITNSGLEGNSNGRSYLGYMIECALGSRSSISSSYAGTAYTYPGSIGLATAWTTRALTTSEMRYVSACVLSRANVFGQSVEISMRGDTSVLATTADEAANYNVEEGAFYGNIFDVHPGAMHACNGIDQVRDGDTYGDLPLRQCAQQDPNNPGYTLCGFVFDGDCSDICVTNGDHYSSCGSQANVITVRLHGTAP